MEAHGSLSLPKQVWGKFQKLTTHFRLSCKRLAYLSRGIVIHECYPQVHYEKHGAVVFENLEMHGMLQDMSSEDSPVRDQILWRTQKRCTDPVVLRQFGLDRISP